MFSAAILVTGGKLLAWICDGYLNHAPFRQYFLASGPLFEVSAYASALIPYSARTWYDDMVAAYFDSNDPARESRLLRLIGDYWKNPDTAVREGTPTY